MAAKLNIQGDLIGTTADNVEYTNSDMNGVTHAKGALDNLNTRMKAVEQGGGGSTPTPVESAEDVSYSKQGWTGVANVKQALDDVHDRLEDMDDGGGHNPATGPVIYAYGDSTMTDELGKEKSSGSLKLKNAQTWTHPPYRIRCEYSNKHSNKHYRHSCPCTKSMSLQEVLSRPIGNWW